MKAGVLKIGERLQPLEGSTRVALISARPGVHRVYNLEVNGEHVYRVTDVGVLVRKSCGKPTVYQSELSHTYVFVSEYFGRLASATKGKFQGLAAMW